ncbi:MAG: rubrerythrin family protein [Ignavibacteria bacterium]|jgi:rubrerythrin|nr:rubrerythrin family protein [Ignavibacteria bacterium]
MATLKGTKTEQNLLKSFAGESQARNRYEFFASVAKKEGYEQIAQIFQITANQEKEHAKTMFKYLEGRELEITAAYPAGKIGTTIENLKAAAAGEKEEWYELYPAFAKTAEEEGFPEIAATYTMICIAEAEHERRYLKLLANIEKNEVFSKPAKVKWYCSNCGCIVEGTDAPDLCPACKHPKAYFQLQLDNF